MLDQLIEKYEEILPALALDTYAYTVTIPDSDQMTPAAAIHRMALDPAMLRSPGLAQPEDLDVIAVDNGIVTLDGVNPCPERKKVTDRLAGSGFKHWYLAIDIEGNKTLYARYGETEGEVHFPEPLAIPFTPWTEFLGPLAPYETLLAPLYDDIQPERSVSAIFLAIIENESGIHFNGTLLERPRLSIPIHYDRPSA
ncbi:hypothetical protein Nocox_37965 [Nonomuraea coxensis DSM 45129]|uniref:Restriction endonuclease domain-containing protein n=1 Tax=Nonomuraea coxensis DSM 45129 TaxID=1122611 RepID=A0ABX8UBK4_9ACTN|nr:hypothetical protein [Nonomuraea coxensis]QYC45143.1 hypothetical protein Nocox_37965 [Nonomuraea coxensis DSM 45129]